MKYRAIDIASTPFKHAYGLSIGKPYEASTIKDLAYYIAYYWHRCSARLQFLDEYGIWVDAAENEQDAFNKELDFRFSYFENK